MLGLAGYNPHVDTHPTASPLLPAPSFADDGPALELYIYYFSPPSVFFFLLDFLGGFWTSRLDS